MNNKQIGAYTTINFQGDLKMSHAEFWKYNEFTIFLIVKQCRSGKYLLCDPEGELIVLSKKNITHLIKEDEEILSVLNPAMSQEYLLKKVLTKKELKFLEDQEVFI
jgi:hypothetical protein